MQRIDEIINGIKGLGGTINEDEVAMKILRSLPKSYSHKVATIEEVTSVQKVTKDQLLGKLTTFEMREFGDALPKIETTFKANTSEKTSRA